MIEYSGIKMPGANVLAYFFATLLEMNGKGFTTVTLIFN
jgi:hypothetical protein